MQFELCDLPPGTEAFRHDVRDFLRETLAGYPASRLAKSRAEGDAEFSHKAARGGDALWPDLTRRQSTGAAD